MHGLRWIPPWEGTPARRPGGGDGVSLPGFTGCLSDLVIAGTPVSLHHNIMEARDLMECSEVTASLMVSDQAEAEDDDLLVFDEEKQIRVMNRVERRSLLEKKSSVSLELLTEDREGDLVTVGTSQSDHLTVSLTQGRLLVRLRLGPDRAEKISQLLISGAGWVSLSLERSGGRLLVRINRDEEIFSLHLQHGQQRKNNKKRILQSDGFLTLGGGLVGQMRNIRIKDKIVKYSDLLVL